MTLEPRPTADAVSPVAAEALHGLLDAPGSPPRRWAPLPPLWHWLAFLPTEPQRRLKADGHPRLQGELARFNDARRMFAGGRLEFVGQAQVGETLRRTSEIRTIEEKTGRSGPLAFVRVRHQILASDALAITDEQQIVYRLGSPTSDSPPEPNKPIPAAPWEWELAIRPTLLFRFSALTYNAHRIHYDRGYATGVEGYPGLVVHGPLQAVVLAELCRRKVPERRLASFTFRALRPAFDTGPIHLRGTPADDEVSLAAYNNEGTCTMTATGRFL